MNSKNARTNDARPSALNEAINIIIEQVSQVEGITTIHFLQDPTGPAVVTFHEDEAGGYELEEPLAPGQPYLIVAVDPAAGKCRSVGLIYDVNRNVREETVETS